MNIYRYYSLSKFKKYYKKTYLKKKLHLTDWQVLNDKMEGHFHYYLSNESESEETVFAKNSYKIASFSKTCLNQMMWAHYGDEGKGLCLEFSFDEEKAKYLIKEISYENKFPFQNIDTEPENRALTILSVKLKCWEREEEIRLFSSEQKEYIQFPFLKEIILGPQFCINCNQQFLSEIRRQFSPMNVKLKQVTQTSDAPYLAKNEEEMVF